jgi:hypothetical protein
VRPRVSSWRAASQTRTSVARGRYGRHWLKRVSCRKVPQSHPMRQHVGDQSRGELGQPSSNKGRRCLSCLVAPQLALMAGGRLERIFNKVTSHASRHLNHLFHSAVNQPRHQQYFQACAHCSHPRLTTKTIRPRIVFPSPCLRAGACSRGACDANILWGASLYVSSPQPIPWKLDDENPAFSFIPGANVVELHNTFPKASFKRPLGFFFIKRSRQGLITGCVKCIISATTNMYTAVQPDHRADVRSGKPKGFRCGKAAHGKVSQVFLRTGCGTEEVRVGSKYSWEALGSRGRHQVLEEGSGYSWEAPVTRGWQQVLVGGSRHSWEAQVLVRGASTRKRHQVLVGVSRCLLGKTARYSAASGH